MSAPARRVPFSYNRLSAIAGNTFLEAVRQKLFLFFLILGAVFVLGARSLGDINFEDSELRFVFDFGLGTLMVFGSILTIVTTAQLFFSEIEHRTALTLLAKPVWRTEFIFGKFLGAFAVVGVFCGLMTGLLIALIWWRETGLMAVAHVQQHRVPYGDIVIAGLLQWLKFGVLANLTLLIASFSNTNLFTVAVSFFALVICHLQYIAHHIYDRMAETSPILRELVDLAARIIPDFQIFNVTDNIGPNAGLDVGLALRAAAYAFVYIGVFGGLAVFSFRRREI
jgi:ABC-type transport system involved in multi-copper enzyme maturation permease subunit